LEKIDLEVHMSVFGILKKKSGFSLVELLVAIALFGILMVAFLSIFMTGFRLTLRAGNRDKAVSDITGKVEQSIASSSALSDVEKNESTAILVFADRSPKDITIDIYTGEITTEDGSEIIITGFETAGYS